MKKIAGAFLVLFSLGTQAKEIKIQNSKIKDVTVFLAGAEVNRTGWFNLKPGISTIVFENLGNGILLNSIQAKGKGEFTILDVQKGNRNERTEVKKDFSKTELQIKALEDSLSFLKFEFEEIKFEQEVIKGEKNLIVNNPSFKTMVDTFPTFKEYTQFYKSELKLINQRIVELNRLTFQLRRKERDFKVELNALRSLISQSNNSIVKTINTITITVSTTKNVNGSIHLKYTLPNAGWKPMYDVRIDEAGAVSKLVYKAKVFQNSGLDWKGVNLTLSTSNPSQVFTAPQLTTHYLDYYREIISHARKKMAYKSEEVAKVAEAMDDYESEESLDNSNNTYAWANAAAPVASTAADYTYVQKNMLDVEYKINLKYNILQGNKEHLVLVHEEDISTQFVDLSIPKRSSKTFSMAQLIGWEKLELIPGKAQIFFDDSYVGETYLNPQVLKDTLDVVLGIDKRVLVTRNHVKTEEKEYISGSKMKKTYTYEIVVKNNNNKTVEIDVFDQIPVSKRKDIQIELLEQSGAKFNEKTGKLSWDLTLKKGEAKNLSFQFSIKFPKDKNINGMQQLAAN